MLAYLLEWTPVRLKALDHSCVQPDAYKLDHTVLDVFFPPLLKLFELEGNQCFLPRKLSHLLDQEFRVPWKGRRYLCWFPCFREKKPKLFYLAQRVFLIWFHQAFQLHPLSFHLLGPIGPSSGFMLLSRLFSLLGMPFLDLRTWYVLVDTSFLFVFSAGKRLTQLQVPVQAIVPVAYIGGKILTPGFLFFLPLIFNSLRFSLLLAFRIVPVLHSKSSFMSFWVHNWRYMSILMAHNSVHVSLPYPKLAVLVSSSTLVMYL